MKPINDKLKVSINPDGPFSDQASGVEKGVVVEVPERMMYFGFHSFAFENSITHKDNVREILEFYQALKGSTVYWETLQDRGRRFKVNGEEFVFLNMTDIIAYSDDPDINVEPVDQTGAAGSFNLS